MGSPVHIRSYLRSAVWTAPVIALALEQTTFRIAYAYQLDFGSVPGFVYGREGAIALADYVITSSTAFIVFTFGSMIVARSRSPVVTRALASLPPCCCATM